jgi:DNA-binding MarR family transcriptional regulator
MFHRYNVIKVVSRGERMDKKEKPIGFWIKEADKSITANVNKNLEQHDLTRFHWQVFNTIYENMMITKEALSDLLSNFFGMSKLDEILTLFVRKNWINVIKNSDTGAIEVKLTEEGKREFVKIRATQLGTRKQLFRGVTNEEYETTIKVLKQLIDNAKTL